MLLTSCSYLQVTQTLYPILFISCTAAGNTLRGPSHPRRFLRTCPPSQKPWYCINDSWCLDTEEYTTYKSIQYLKYLAGVNDKFMDEFKRITTGIFQTGFWISSTELQELQGTWMKKGLTKEDRQCMALALLENWCQGVTIRSWVISAVCRKM